MAGMDLGLEGSNGFGHSGAGVVFYRSEYGEIIEPYGILGVVGLLIS